MHAYVQKRGPSFASGINALQNNTKTFQAFQVWIPAEL